MHHVDNPFPGGGQSYRDVVTASRTLLRDLTARYDGRRVLVIAHSANRWALQALLTGADLHDVIASPFRWQPGWEYTVPSP